MTILWSLYLVHRTLPASL